LELIARMLIDRETIEGDELEELFDGPRPKPVLIGPPLSSPASRPEQDTRDGGRSGTDYPSGGRLLPLPAN
jgi:cell division protease FtsH